MRDIASSFYLQGGENIDPNGSFLKLVASDISTMQPSLYFRVHSTPFNGYWSIETATHQYLKVNTAPGPQLDMVRWTAVGPASDTVVDKSPYYFSFVHVSGTESPRLYIMKTFYNDGMVLSQPSGPGTALLMEPAQAQIGDAPSLCLEISVTGENTVQRSVVNGIPIGLMNNVGINSASSDSSDVDTTTSTISVGAAVVLTIFCVVAFFAMAFLAFMLYRQYYPAGWDIPQATDQVEPAPSPATTYVAPQPSAPPAPAVVVKPAPVVVVQPAVAVPAVAVQPAPVPEEPATETGAEGEGEAEGSEPTAPDAPTEPAPTELPAATEEPAAPDAPTEPAPAELPAATEDTPAVAPNAPPLGGTYTKSPLINKYVNNGFYGLRPQQTSPYIPLPKRVASVSASRYGGGMFTIDRNF